jgi:ribonuclease G
MNEETRPQDERPEAETSSANPGGSAADTEAAPAAAPAKRAPRKRAPAAATGTPRPPRPRKKAVKADEPDEPAPAEQAAPEEAVAPAEPEITVEEVQAAIVEEPDRLLLSLGKQEVSSTGEALSLRRRDKAPPSANGETILVPEAAEETAPFLDLPLDTRTQPLGLPPITPELLAEVRSAIDQSPRTERGRDRDRPQPPRPAPIAPPSPAPDLILVAEAILETVPEDWAEEDPTLGEPLRSILPGDVAGRGRRRRGRGRGGRREDEAQEETVAVAPAPKQETGPIILGRGDDERGDRGERERRDREVRTEREYKEILINVGERETRIAVLENGRLVELHVEREERVVGNISKGKVVNVLPGMDAAFVDIGLDRNAFLYVGDILFEDSGKEGGSGGAGGPRKTSRDIKIKDVAKPGQEILVQIVKGPRGTKGARVSTKISIPGRYLVLMPEGDHLGVSRKVEDPRERDRLKKIADQLQPKGFGLIVRTEAEGRTDQELRQDLDYLVSTWGKISEKNRKIHAPAILHKDLGIILKTIRDLFGQDVDKLILDDVEEHEKVVDTLQQLAPDLVDRVILHDEPEPLFNKFHVEEEIDRLLRRKIWLRNGAYLLLDTTEALTTIDVNTGKFVGTSSLAETILKTNLDAVDEIARQLRLRDIGGMIVLDFIDMSSSRDRQLVMRKLEEAFRKDRTRTKIAHISPLGLVEMTRKRTAENVTDVMSDTCPYCQGRGRVWSPETMAIQIEREIMKLCAAQEVDAILVHCSSEVAAWMIGAEGESVERLERLIRRPVYVRARQDFHIEKFEVTPGDMMEMERGMMPFHGGQVVEALVAKNELITAPRSAAWVDGYFVDLANGAKLDGQRTRVRLTDVRRSFAIGEPLAPATAVDRSEPI